MDDGHPEKGGHLFLMHSGIVYSAYALLTVRHVNKNAHFLNKIPVSGDKVYRKSFVD